jgi:short-subunit dehydrogenase
MSHTLITGASEGIGKVFAQEFARKKKNLVLVARSADKLEALALRLRTEFAVDVQVIVADLAKLGAAEELASRLSQMQIQIETLVNNAGFGLIERFEKHHAHRMEEMLLLNIVTLTKLTHALLPQIKESRGNIINVASSAAFQPVPYMAVYAASKAFVLHFSEALHHELAASGVEVLALCPGATATEFFKVAGLSGNNSQLPMQTADEVVKTALHALEQKKAVVVSGWKNQLSALSVRLAPRSLVTQLAGRMMSSQRL